MAKKTPVQIPCSCSKYSVNEWDEAKQDWNTKATTGCRGVLTARTFAPGHDAKLKGFLIRAGIAGDEVSDDQGITAHAFAMAARYGFEVMVRQGVVGGILKLENKKLKKGERSELAEAAQARVDAMKHDGNEARQEREAKGLEAQVAAEEAKYAEQRISEAAQAWRESQADEEWADAHTDEDKARYADPSEPTIVKAKVGRWTYEGTVEGDTFTYEAKGEVRTSTKFTLV